MVSPLWNAASDGNIDVLLGLLQNASPADIEIKDHTGATPLQEAVKHGHLDVARALLDKGADPSFVLTHGSLDAYSTNPGMVELLKNVTVKGLSPQDHPYSQNPHDDPSKRFYSVPIPPYGYYTSLPPVPSLPDGSPAYYQPPPMPLSENSAFGNLPPPEIARFIPCRYYPACRYGSSCIFLHPQGPYYHAPPPAQFPSPYDPMSPQQYAPGYFPPPPFHPPAAAPHMNPVSSPPHPPVHSPHPPVVHARSASDVLSPVQTPVPMAYGPMSPPTPSYPQPPHAPLPLSIPTLPPPHQPATAPGPQSPQSMYPNGPVSAPPFAVRQDPSPYPGPHTHSPYVEVNSHKSPVLSQGENFAPPPTFRQGMNHNRRGSSRRGSFGGNRKPACLFYPAGRCRNGDECRFPHVIHDTPTQPQSGSRGPRARDGANDVNAIEGGFASMNVQDDVHPRRGTNGTTNSSRSQSTDPGSRPKAFKSNGSRPEKKLFVKQQRVPNADEFPVLGGSTTTSSRSSVSGAPVVNGLAGPTVAQILQAPRPSRKDTSREPGTRSVSPEEHQVKSQFDDKLAEVNPAQSINGTTGNIGTKLPISFAAAATGTPESAKEVSVSA